MKLLSTNSTRSWPSNCRGFAISHILAACTMLLSLSACKAQEMSSASTTRPARVLQTADMKDFNDGHVISTETFYVDERGQKVLHGRSIVWHDFGKRLKDSESHYADGKLDGWFIDWFPNGVKAIEGRYEQDQRVGCWIWWQPTGDRAAECTFVAGKGIVGSKLYWNDKAKLVREDRYENGYERELTIWYDNGKKKLRGTFMRPDDDNILESLDNLKDGTWQYWNPDGTLRAEGVWKRGKPWSGVCGTPGAGSMGSVIGFEHFGLYKEGRLVQPVTRPAQPEIVD